MPPRQALLLQMQSALSDTMQLLKTWSSAPKPETLHQTLVAWRRLKCLSQFYRPQLAKPSSQHQWFLRALWQRTGQLRNLDVALNITLPAWHQNHPDTGCQEWTALIRHLQRKRRNAQQGLKTTLAQNEAQAEFLVLRDGMQRLPTPPQHMHNRAWNRWTRHRLKALLKKIKKSHKDSHPKRQHARRILIKQARYVLDGLEIPQAGRKIRHQHQRTRQMQKTLGKDQDKRATLALIESSGLFPTISRAWRLSN